MSIMQLLPLTLLIGVTAGTAFDAKLPVPGDTPWSIEEVTFCPEAATADDAANYAKIQVLASDGTTVLAEWSTKDDEEGALADGIPVNLPFSAEAGAAFYGAQHYKVSGNSTATSVRVKVVHTGTGAAIAGRLLVTLKRDQRIQPRA